MPEVSYTTLWNLSEEEVAKALQNSRFKVPKPVSDDFIRDVVAVAYIGDQDVYKAIPILCSDIHISLVYGVSVKNVEHTLLTTMVPHEGSWAIVCTSGVRHMLLRNADEYPTDIGYLVAHEIGKLMSGYYWYWGRLAQMKYINRPFDFPSVRPQHNHAAFAEIPALEQAMMLVAGGISRDDFEADRYAASLIGFEAVIHGLAFLMAEAAMTHDTYSQMELHNRIIHHMREMHHDTNAYHQRTIHHSLKMQDSLLGTMSLIIKVPSTGSTIIPAPADIDTVEQLLSAAERYMTNK